MSNDRGQYGRNGVSRVGATVYVERKGASIGAWLLGAVAIGGGILYARHQSQQIEKLYKTGGLPYQTFAGSLGESARALPTRAREAYRGFTARVRPAKPAPASIAAPTTEQIVPAHSVRSRSGRR